MRFEQDCVRNICRCALVVVGAGGTTGHFIEVVREWIHCMWRIHFAGRVMGVQGRVQCHIKQVHLLGDGGVLFFWSVIPP